MSAVQHCWICEQTEDQRSVPLERDCACQGTVGYAHLSCLIECARIKSGFDPPDYSIWTTCPICHHGFNGDVQLSLARARLAFAESIQLPTEHEEYLVAMQMYSVALVKCLNDFNAALPFLKKALQIRWRAQGSDHTVTLIATATLAMLYQKMGKDDLALPLFEEALQGFRSKPDVRESWATLITILNLARLHMQNGNFSDSLPLAEEAMVGFWWTLGKEHEDTLSSIELLGELHFHMAHGEYIDRNKAESHDGPCDVTELEHAKALLMEAWVGYHETLGEQHRKTVSAEGFLRIVKGKIENFFFKQAYDSLDSKCLDPLKGTVDCRTDAEKYKLKKAILRGLQLANLALHEFHCLSKTETESNPNNAKMDLTKKVSEHVTKALKRCHELFSNGTPPSETDTIDRAFQNKGQTVTEEASNNNDDVNKVEEVERKVPPAKRSKLASTE